MKTNHKTSNIQRNITDYLNWFLRGLGLYPVSITQAIRKFPDNLTRCFCQDVSDCLMLFILLPSFNRPYSANYDESCLLNIDRNVARKG